MKKTSAKSRNIGREEAEVEEEEEEHGGNVEETPTVHLGNVGVKVEGEGQVEGPGGLLREVVEAPWEALPAEGELAQAHVVDLTQQFNRIFVQTTFNSFKEFEKLFNKFKAETGSVFRIKSSCSIAYENSRRKKHFIPSRFKFVTVRYCCVHYGQPKMAGQGIRTKQRYLPCGCESMLSVSYNRGALVISQANMRHNHDVSSEMAPFYAINRRISNAELREVASVVEMISSSRALQHFLQIHFHRPTTLQDAKNIRARLKALKAPEAPTTRTEVAGESGTALFEEEEEEEQDEDAVMDGINEDETVRKVDGECGYWEETTIFEARTEENQQHYEKGDEEVRAKEEEEELEPELDPDMRKEVLNEVRSRLFNVMENCSAKVFQERVSVIEKLIEGWENGDPVHLQYMDDSDFRARTLEPISAHHTDPRLPEEQMLHQNDTNENSLMPVDGLDVALPVMGIKGTSQLFPSQANSRLIKEHSNQIRVTGVMEVNGNTSTITHKPDYGTSGLYKTDTHCSIQKAKSSERRPMMLSIVKGLVGGGDQAMEVVIEVDGGLAEVKAVKREPLDYYEVSVGDW